MGAEVNLPIKSIVNPFSKEGAIKINADMNWLLMSAGKATLLFLVIFFPFILNGG